MYNSGQRVLLSNQHAILLSEEECFGQKTYKLWLEKEQKVITLSEEELKADLQEGESSSSLELIITKITAAKIQEALTEDTLLAPIESNVTPLPHQIHALKKAISSEKVRYLFADEVGLGKTIEAGLVIRELKSRGLAKRILVLAPKGLVTQWGMEMKRHFNENFSLIQPSDIATLRRLYSKFGEESKDFNSWEIADQVICPVDSVKPLETRKGWSREKVQEYNAERFESLVSANWDLIVVDEAHRLSGMVLLNVGKMVITLP